MIIRTPLAAALLLAIGSGAQAQSVDTPPSTPGNPVARVYGPTSGGIAWQRSSDDRAVRGYEITRDGTVIGVRDTLSYVAMDLVPGRAYTFVIVAIDSAGQRSGRAVARIETPDVRPNEPTGLVANIYSATAAGISWQRSGVLGERYEVKRDGVVVAAATSGTSYVDTTLSARRPYLFEIIAINRQGQRSPSASLFFGTTDGPNTPPAAVPAAPGGLRAVAYSATAGAIAWDRSRTAGIRYEIRRDGTVVATTDGTSYVDGSLAPGTAYAYDVTAIAGTRRSNASSVTLVTPQNRTEPPMTLSSVIAVENREEVLANVLEVISGEIYRSAFAVVDYVLLGGDGTTLVSEELGPLGESISVSECAEGGRFENTSLDTALSVSNDIVVRECRIDGIVFNGTVRSASAFSDGTSTVLVTDLTITQPNGDLVSLVSERGDSSLTLFDSRMIDVTRYEATGPEGSVSIEEANSAVSSVTYADVDPTQSAAFIARISAPWTGGDALEIRMGKPFVIPSPPGVDSDQETYTSGSLVARASDGSRLVIDADNGDPGSFTLTIDADGGTSSFTVTVGDGVQIPCLGLADSENEAATPLACKLDLGNRFR